MRRLAIDLETVENLAVKHDPDLPIVSAAIYGKHIQKCFFFPEEEQEFVDAVHDYAPDEIIIHNASFDVAVLRSHGHDWIDNYPIHDTMCMSYTLNPDSIEHHSLGNLAPLVGLQKLLFPGSQAPKEQMEVYNIRDAEITYKLFYYFWKLLCEEPELLDYYEEIERPYTGIVMQIEHNGMCVARELLHELDVELRGQEETLLEEMRKLVPPRMGKVVQFKKKVVLRQYTNPQTGKLRVEFTGEQGGEYDHCTLSFFNPKSPTQVADAMISAGWIPTVFTPSGAPSTTADLLRGLDIPLAKVLAEYKQVQKVQSTFTTPLILATENDPFVRCSIKQYHTRTRRLSSEKPNLQNIPARSELGKKVRRLFVAPEGRKLVVGDLDRIEVVVLAFYIENILGNHRYADLMRDGYDVHTYNAETWGCERPYAKNGLFAVIYGAGVNKFSETIKVPLSEGKRIYEAMKEASPELFELQDFFAEFAEDKGGVYYDYFGGKIWVPEIMSQDPEEYARGRRLALNYTIQGTAGSVFKHLQLAADSQVNPETLLHNVVHDEAIYSSPEEIAEEEANLLTRLYTSSLDGVKSIPVRAKFHVGDNWLEAKGE